MHPLLNIALQAARDAAEAIAHSSDRLDRIKIINDDPAHFLTSMDLEAEKTIFYHLEKASPRTQFSLPRLWPQTGRKQRYCMAYRSPFRQ